jgi:pimeloyl-ACP methyl ester carboxylesterase
MASIIKPVDGFRPAFDRFGSPDRASVVLLHGWPGLRRDYRLVVAQLADVAYVVVPDLRGFGVSDEHLADPRRFYSADAQARSVAGLIDELGLEQVVVGGYDIAAAGVVASASRARHRARSFSATAGRR